MRIEGIVVHGRQLGRTLGFPTANLQPRRVDGEGPEGVYAAWFELDGERLPCMLNVGSHPTLPGGGQRFEAHIFHFDRDIYGRSAVVETVQYLRGETRFSSPDALREQLERDRERCLKLLNTQTPPSIK